MDGDSDPYTILGLTRDVADLKLVRKAYYGLAIHAHPDKGGSEDQMALLFDAYEKVTSSLAGLTPVDTRTAGHGSDDTATSNKKKIPTMDEIRRDVVQLEEKTKIAYKIVNDMFGHVTEPEADQDQEKAHEKGLAPKLSREYIADMACEYYLRTWAALFVSDDDPDSINFEEFVRDMVPKIVEAGVMEDLDPFKRKGYGDLMVPRARTLEELKEMRKADTMPGVEIKKPEIKREVVRYEEPLGGFLCTLPTALLTPAERELEAPDFSMNGGVDYMRAFYDPEMESIHAMFEADMRTGNRTKDE